MTKQEVIQDFKNSFGTDLDYVKEVREHGKTTIRCMFIDHVDSLSRDGLITERQRNNITASDRELCLTKRITVKGV